MDALRTFVVVIAMIAVCSCSDAGSNSGPAVTAPPPTSTPTATATPTTPPASPPTGTATPALFPVTVQGSGHTEQLQVEVAATEADRERGLMDRQSMPEDHGMIFLFPRDSEVGFWMKDTPLPLTIAYIAADGTVQQLVDGRPFDQTILSPTQPYRYVLEVNQGWFARHGLGVGSKVILPSGLPAAR